jgi:hypothetical protein
MDTLTLGMILSILYFLELYLIAFLTNFRYREKDDVLFIKKYQWKALLVLWSPVLLAIIIAELRK